VSVNSLYVLVCVTELLDLLSYCAHNSYVVHWFGYAHVCIYFYF